MGESNIEADIEQAKIDLLIEQGNIQLDLHQKIFSTIDTKTQWFFAIIAATESYMIIHYFIYKEINLFLTGDFILICSLLLGGVILCVYIHILRSRTFKTGPNICNYFQKFLNNGKTYFELSKDLLGTLTDSYYENDKVLIDKAKWFKKSTTMLFIYFLLIISYFLITH